MIEKLQLFFDLLLLPLSWLPDFSYNVLTRVAFVVSVFFIAKVVNVLK